MKVYSPEFFPVEFEESEIEKIGDVLDIFEELFSAMNDNHCDYTVSKDDIRLNSQDIKTVTVVLRQLVYHVPIRIE